MIVIVPGAKVGRLTAISPGRKTFPNGRTAKTWLMRCECGKERVCDQYALSAEKQLSCGCLRNEKVSVTLTKHGGQKNGARLPQYAWWSNMKQRCSNPRNPAYKYYGERGIKVCDRWLYGDSAKTGFEYFVSDMGEKPSPDHSVDRIDNDGNYEPGNCRWATNREQVRNRRKPKPFTAHRPESRAKISEAVKGIWAARKASRAAK